MAIAALKKRKLLEAQYNTVANQKMTLESQILALESAKINEMAVHSMQEARMELERCNKTASVEKVDHVIEDLQEKMADQQEISEALSTPFNTNVDFDDDDLEKELEELGDNELINEFTNTYDISKFTDKDASSIDNIPEYKGNDLSKEEIDSDEELRRIEESLK
eukprot:GHVP01069073.1.p1 GENE.GHVP01069073.1~~GHVP01069073.1.p1  ORF type:complete len:165 (+),score=58.79 GHVP01069073.1:506-1000(+)